MCVCVNKYPSSLLGKRVCKSLCIYCIFVCACVCVYVCVCVCMLCDVFVCVRKYEEQRGSQGVENGGRPAR